MPHENIQSKTAPEKQNSQAGFTLAEFLIASLILLMVASAVFELLSEIQLTTGYQTEVQTVHGSVTLKIPSGTQNNKIFKLKGKGAPHFQRGGTGDHLVEIIVAVPDSLSRSQKKAIQGLEKEGL